MNRNFFDKRIKKTKNDKLVKRSSNTAHTTSSDRTVTKQRRKRKNKVIGSGYINQIKKIV